MRARTKHHHNALLHNLKEQIVSFILLIGIACLCSFVLLSLSSLLSKNASASAFYTQVGGGVTKMQGASTFFQNPSLSGFSDLGFWLEAGVFYKPADGDPLVELHFGVLHKFSQAPAGSSAVFMQVPYPMVRVQMSLLYFGFGASPFVFRGAPSTSLSPNYLDMKAPSGALAGLGEVGVLWSVTPKFSLAANVTGQFVSSGGSLSPAPSLEGGVSLRFYWGFSKNHGSERSSEFKGWRYPFGREMN